MGPSGQAKRRLYSNRLVSKEGPNYSFRLLSVRGIPIRIHLTLFLLLGWVAYDALSAGGSPVTEVAFVSLLLGCVVLHELGHALMAQCFGIGTRDIVLYPFGGIATIMAEAKPLAELFIALAGPLVNVLIAMGLSFSIDTPKDAEELLLRNDIPSRLLLANAVLVAFNMIPALPMDGGRVLRALLALLRVPRSTTIAARLSQLLSLLMGLFALYSTNPMLLLIAVLVFSQASREHLSERTRLLAAGLSVKDAMTESKHLVCFPHGLTIASAFPIAIKSLQPYFPVLHADNLIGLVERDALIEAGAIAEQESYVGSLANRDFVTLAPQLPLTDLLNNETLRAHDVFVVSNNEIFQGLLFRDRLLEFLLLNGMRKEHQQLVIELRDNEIP